MRVVIAPDSFKDALPADRVAKAMAQGVRAASPSAELDLIPMADGGQGTMRAVLASSHGERRSARVTGPLGQPVDAEFALLKNGELALFEMASASGLELVPVADRNPMITTTRGTGELLRAALDAGARHLLIGIGGSATNDGGTGLAQALGYRLLDHEGNEIPPGGKGLAKLASIDPTSRDPRLGTVRIDVACDVVNPILGPTGASAVYGPQKGATPLMIEQLEQSLQRLIEIVRRDLGKEMDGPGAGAAGALGGGLVAFAEAQLRRGVDVVIEAVSLRERLEGADLCLTGEGQLDAQSSFGKTVSGIARLCQEFAVPLVVIPGSRKGNLSPLYDAGMTAAFDITPSPMSLSDALKETEENLAITAEQVVRLWLAARPV